MLSLPMRDLQSGGNGQIQMMPGLNPIMLLSRLYLQVERVPSLLNDVMIYSRLLGIQ